MNLNYSFIIRNRPRKNGKPNYQLILSYRAKDGTWKQASKSGFMLRSLAASDKEKEKLLAEVKKTGDIDAIYDGITLREFGEIYLQDRPTLAPNSLFLYRKHLKAMPSLLDKPMADITYLDVSRLVSSFRHSPNTVKSRVTFLKMLFKAAVKYHVIGVNPIADYTYRVRDDSVGKSKIRTMTDEEIGTLSDYLHDADREAWILVQIAVYTGARIGEILALTSSDIDLHGLAITISKQYTRTDRDNESVHGMARVKSKHSNRTVPIPPVLASALSEYFNERVLYVHRRLTRFNSVSVIDAYFRKITPGHSIHDLRHTYATRILAEGLDIKTVASLLGDTVGTVESVYVHYTDEMRARAACDIARIFG